jgi:hypothetical protein
MSPADKDKHLATISFILVTTKQMMPLLAMITKKKNYIGGATYTTVLWSHEF